MVWLPEIPGVLFVEESAKEDFLGDLKKYLDSDPETTEASIVEYATVSDDTIHLFNIKAGVEQEGHIFTTHNAEASASVFRIFKDTGSKVNSVDFHVLQAKAEAQLGTAYIGAGVSLNLVGGTASAFSANLGFGVATGVGIRDEAIEVEVLGCGITVGKRIGISVFGNSIEINFGKFF
ncbi:hypothetical protein C8J56DRAFT_961550 [Mycena floridula]|nr:hypothetical protein C8J56DRAFT_961550 [Mycena floridula]